MRSHDPTELKNTLVYMLSHDVRLYLVTSILVVHMCVYLRFTNFLQKPTPVSTSQVEEMPESSFIAQHRENMPPPDRTTTSIASWREIATGQAAAAVAHSRGRSRGGR